MPTLTKTQLSQLNSSLLSFVTVFESGSYDVSDRADGNVVITLNLIAGKRPETGGGLKKNNKDKNAKKVKLK
ncbi:hypothetical protein [Ferruginibacter sp.]